MSLLRNGTMRTRFGASQAEAFPLLDPFPTPVSRDEEQRAVVPSPALGTSRGSRRFPTGAFTLIEMLVVVGVIGILAGLVLYMAGGAAESNQRGAAEALIQQVDLAIRSYKDAKGYFPPDSSDLPNFPARPPLYYELKGTKSINANERQMLDDDHIVQRQAVQSTFGMEGFLNSQDVGETTEARDFLPNLRTPNIGSPNGDDAVRFIVFPRAGPDGNRFNAVRYDKSSGQRHNLDGFDIWIDLSIGGRTVTVGNW